ncbi:MAG: TonB-dependent receptor, partial [Vicinamibacterales bacterium]
MNHSILIRAALAGCVALAVMPASVLAQSSIVGVVRDTSGAVLPGVNVEAESPALIERVKGAVSDDQGRYAIAGLRPGIYRLTFGLQGFVTSVRNGLELPANFTSTVNAELQLGDFAESVTVTGVSPVVDVQNAQKQTVIPRAMLDAVPIPRMFVAEAALVVGTKISSQNVGGTRAAVNPRVTAHGSVTKDTTIEVDGMKMNTLVGGGDSHPDHNDGMIQEMSVRISAIGADVSAGGPHINLIPREGGNDLSGATYVGYSNGAMQFDNLTPDLIQRGLATPDAVKLVYDANASVGGAIRRDRLWFFGSLRQVGNENEVANSFYPDGSPGIYDQRVGNYTARLTWQPSSGHKLSAYYDYQTKFVGHLLTPGIDVMAALRRPPVIKYTTAAKWTSAFRGNFAIDAGYGISVNSYTEKYQLGVEKDPFTPEWYATASRVDLVAATTKVAGMPQTGTFNFRYMLMSSMTYVAGAHALKAGLQWHIGNAWNTAQANADLTQRYRDGVPDSVIVYNTPARRFDRMNKDIGIYLQDSFTLKRLTVNPGIRLELFNSSIEAKSVEAGRFVPARTFPKVPNTPDWLDLAPRLGIAYDLTGDAKTAIKAGVNKYNRNFTLDFAQRYDPLALQSDTRNWSDCDYLPGTSTCSPLTLPTNRDGIAQNNEIGPSNNNRFGLTPARNPDPNIKRPYDIEYTVAIDRQVLPGVAVTVAYYHRQTYNLEVQDNLLTEVSDYTPFQTPNPMDGQPITIYNLNRAKQGLVDLLDLTSTDNSKSRFVYNGFEVSFAARLPRGASMFGGWSTDRNVTVSCAGYDPNTFRFCDQSALNMPLRHDFKFAGSQPLPWGLSLGATLQSYAGAMQAVN